MAPRPFENIFGFRVGLSLGFWSFSALGFQGASVQGLESLV